MSGIPLARLELRCPAVLERPGPGALPRLLELGFVEGTEVVLLRRGPLGDPLEIELRGYRICVRASDLCDLRARPRSGGVGGAP